MYPSVVLTVVFVYIIALFCVAKWADKKRFVENSWVRHPAIYALALGVYCTSWTFYGLVGTASEKGWNFLPILLGPILLFSVGYPVLERIYHICRQEHIHSIADFIASRYGKRQGVAATVSVVVLFATIPYIALQLKAVSDTLLLTLGENFLVSQDLTLVIAIAMMGFALAFGAKQLDMSGYHSGIMSAVALESIVKLLVLIVVAVFSVLYFYDPVINVEPAVKSTEAIAPVFYQPIQWPRFILETFLAMCAVLCLPRMFHITFVECLSIEHMRQSRSLFVGYLLVIALCIAFVAIVGNSVFLQDGMVAGDAYMIALPLHHDVPWLAVIAFLGGFSAATAMVIVATITLSQMLSNDVILPLLIRRQQPHGPQGNDLEVNQKSRAKYSRHLIFYRRFTVVFVVAAAYVYQVVLAENAALTSIGLIAFALAVQLAPGFLCGLFWRKGNATGLYAGLSVGCALWFYTLMIPLLVDAGVIGDGIIWNGLWGIEWLRPEHLFNLTFSDSFTRGASLSLLANVIFYWWYSWTTTESFSDRIQSAAFVQLKKGEYKPQENIDLNHLKSLLAEFIGGAETNALFSRFDLRKDPLALHKLVDESQQLLASIVGIASSQSMIASLYSGKKIDVEEIVGLVGQTAKALRFNKEILSASFESISSGISVVDSEMKLVAWNYRYNKMFKYPDDFLQVGMQVAKVMRLNAKRGMLGEGNLDDLVHKRLSYMVEGANYRVVRKHDDDTMIEIKGQPLLNGGYITTYDDITEFMRTQRYLEEANANLEESNTTLEQRVQDRTRTIEDVNENLIQEIQQRTLIEEKLREAKQLADAANASKTKFLALASHDIMQPLNAANLYASALLDAQGNLKSDTNIVKRLQSAIANTESIISTLLEVSKVDSAVLKPKKSTFSLDDMLCSTIAEVSVQLPEGIQLNYVKTSAAVFSDRHYLQRIVQNFISNAIKYTENGRVLIGCRRRLDKQGESCMEISVLDTGMGISAQEQNSIFNDFYRIESKVNRQHQIPGVGLGLSVVARFGELLQHPVKCRSELGRGSCFSVLVPLSTAIPEAFAEASASADQNTIQHMKVIYVDDEQQNLLATAALLERWQCNMVPLQSIAAAKRYLQEGEKPDVLLMDYQLDQPDITGIDLAQQMVDIWQQQYGYRHRVPVCIISAATEIDLPQRVKDAGFQFLRKPVKPGRLRALLNQLQEKRQTNTNN